MRRRHFDLGIDVRGEFPHAVMLWLAGARRRLGWAGGGGGFLLTDAAEFVPDRPEVESRLALLGELGILPGAWGEPPRPEFRPSDAARRTVAGWFQKIEDQKPLWQNGGGRQKSPRPRIALHVGAGTPAKRWPVEHWRRLAARLVEKHDAQVVLLGDASDRGTARAITGPRPDPRMADWTGRLGLDELAAALEQVEVLVGADSGPAHLAAAVGTAVVVLFSGTNNPQQWQPRGENVRVLLHPVECSPCHRRQCAWRHHPCMRNLTPEAVVEGVESSLSECCSTVREAEPPVSVFPGGAWEQRDAASSAE